MRLISLSNCTTIPDYIFSAFIFANIQQLTMCAMPHKHQ